MCEQSLPQVKFYLNIKSKHSNFKKSWLGASVGILGSCKHLKINQNQNQSTATTVKKLFDNLMIVSVKNV